MIDNKYFAVHINCKVQGQSFRHGVCYKLNDMIRPSIEKMAKEGSATIYDEPVRIVTGKAYPLSVQKQVVQVIRGTASPLLRAVSQPVQPVSTQAPEEDTIIEMAETLATVQPVVTKQVRKRKK